MFTYVDVKNTSNLGMFESRFVFRNGPSRAPEGGSDNGVDDLLAADASAELLDFRRLEIDKMLGLSPKNLDDSGVDKIFDSLDQPINVSNYTENSHTARVIDSAVNESISDLKFIISEKFKKVHLSDVKLTGVPDLDEVILGAISEGLSVGDMDSKQLLTKIRLAVRKSPNYSSKKPAARRALILNMKKHLNSPDQVTPFMYKIMIAANELENNPKHSVAQNDSDLRFKGASYRGLDDLGNVPGPSNNLHEKSATIGGFKTSNFDKSADSDYDSGYLDKKNIQPSYKKDEDVE